MRDIGSTEKNRGSMLGFEIVSAIDGLISSSSPKKERLFCFTQEFVVSERLYLMFLKEKAFIITLLIFATV